MTTRKQRGKTQMLYLVECMPIDDKDPYSRVYRIMGSTGNIYEVNIKSKPECSCPDFVTRHNRCKHIYFTLIRIMKVSPENEDKYSFSSSDLDTMFESIPDITNNLMISTNFKTKYDKLKDKLGANEKKEATKKDTDDVCPICLDDLENGENLEYCKYHCGKPVHETCFKMWTKYHTPICVYCRGSWNSDDSELKYVNLIY